jgi:disulfide bond formation protein DsbB
VFWFGFCVWVLYEFVFQLGMCVCVCVLCVEKREGRGVEGDLYALLGVGMGDCMS